MKKMFLSVFSLVILASINVHAQEMITKKQLEKYSDALGYLGCMQSGDADNCQSKDYSSTSEAREAIKAFRKAPAAGLNKSEKDALDKQAEDALLVITEDELRDYAKYIYATSEQAFLDLLAEEAIVKTVLIEPSVDSHEKAYHGDFKSEEHANLFTRVIVKTKSDLKADMESRDLPEEKPSTENPTQVGLEPIKEKARDITYDLVNESKEGITSTSKELDIVAISAKKTFQSSYHVKRYPELDYKIQIFEYKMISKTQIKENVFDEDELPRYVAKPPADVLNNTADDAWTKRYDDVEKADRDVRARTTSQRILELTSDNSISRYEEMYKIYRLKEAAKLTEKQRSVLYKSDSSLVVDPYTEKSFSYALKKESYLSDDIAEEGEKISRSLANGQYSYEENMSEGSCLLTSGLEDEDDAYDFKRLPPRDICSLYNIVKSFRYQSEFERRFEAESEHGINLEEINFGSALYGSY